MTKPHVERILITLAIPTYNRLAKLKVLLGSIESQVGGTFFDCQLVICNSESTDGTFDYIEKMEPFGVVSKIIKSNSTLEPGAPRPANVYNLFRMIPADGGWVWIIGDDDYLVSPNCLLKIATAIRDNASPNLALIHPVQGRRSKGSGAVKRLNLLDGVNAIGFHELLGWLSSLILRADLIEPVLLSEFFDPIDYKSESGNLNRNKVLADCASAFRHSAQILKGCSMFDILIIDDYFADPQDADQTPETIARWSEESMSIRYMFVVDDIEYLLNLGIIDKGVSATFFRYLTYFFWDRYAHFVVTDVLNTGSLSDYSLAFMERIERIEKLLVNPFERYMYRSWKGGLFNSVEDIIKHRKYHLEKCQNLHTAFVVEPSRPFSFEVLQ